MIGKMLSLSLLPVFECWKLSWVNSFKFIQVSWNTVFTHGWNQRFQIYLNQSAVKYDFNIYLIHLASLKFGSMDLMEIFAAVSSSCSLMQWVHFQVCLNIRILPTEIRWELAFFWNFFQNSWLQDGNEFVNIIDH